MTDESTAAGEANGAAEGGAAGQPATGQRDRSIGGFEAEPSGSAGPGDGAEVRATASIGEQPALSLDALAGLSAGRARELRESAMADPKFVAAFLDGNHPDHAAAVARQQTLAGIEDGTSPELPADNGFADLSPEDARFRIRMVREDDKFMAAFMDRNHRNHAEAVRAMRELKEIAGGGPGDGNSLLGE